MTPFKGRGPQRIMGKAFDTAPAVPSTESAEQRLAAFGAYCLRTHRNDGSPGDIDGCEAQNEAIRLGLLEPFTVRLGCGDGCECLSGGADFDDTCYRYTAAARAAMTNYPPETKGARP